MEVVIIGARAAIYVRVSTEEQANEGYSIEAQSKVLEAWATVKGCTNIERYADEGFSAKNLNRPRAQQLIRDCKAGLIDYVIVWRLDRLFRSLRDTLDVVEDVFLANRVELISTSENIDTSTPAGRLMLNILASIAQNEREVTEERVRMVSAELAKQCQHLGGVPPFGYDVVDKQYTVNDMEAEAVRTIFSMFDSGRGYDQIIRWLNMEGHKTRRGLPFGKNSLHDLLLNEKYIGTYTYNRTVATGRTGKRNNHKSKPADQIIRIPGGIPAIVDMALWDQVQEKMQENIRTAGRSNARVVYMLSGLIYCGVCGRHMVAQCSGRDRDGTMQRRYACAGCCVRRVRYEYIDHVILDRLTALAGAEGLIRHAVEIADGLLDMERDDQLESGQVIRSEIAAAHARIRSLLDYIAASGAAAPASITQDIRSMEDKIKALQSELHKAESHRTKSNADEMIRRLHAVSNARALDPLTQKETIAAAVRRVTVYNDRFDLVLDNCSDGGGEPFVKGGLSGMGVVFALKRAQGR